jgi:hypothetical protein
MTTTLTRPSPAEEVRKSLPTSRTYIVLMALGTVAILLQGLWAGEIALILVAAATLTAFLRVRMRRDLWVGGGGLIRDSGKNSLTALHIPLAMAIIGLSVWLLMRSRGRI